MTDSPLDNLCATIRGIIATENTPLDAGAKIEKLVRATVPRLIDNTAPVEEASSASGLGTPGKSAGAVPSSDERVERLHNDPTFCTAVQGGFFVHAARRAVELLGTPAVSEERVREIAWEIASKAVTSVAQSCEALERLTKGMAITQAEDVTALRSTLESRGKPDGETNKAGGDARQSTVQPGASDAVTGSAGGVTAASEPSRAASSASPSTLAPSATAETCLSCGHAVASHALTRVRGNHCRECMQPGSGHRGLCMRTRAEALILTGAVEASGKAKACEACEYLAAGSVVECVFERGLWKCKECGRVLSLAPASARTQATCAWNQECGEPVVGQAIYCEGHMDEAARRMDPRPPSPSPTMGGVPSWVPSVHELRCARDDKRYAFDIEAHAHANDAAEVEGLRRIRQLIATRAPSPDVWRQACEAAAKVCEAAGAKSRTADDLARAIRNLPTPSGETTGGAQ